MSFIDREDLAKRALEMGITLSVHQLEQFELFAKILDEWNHKINLTAVPVTSFVERHFLDSLTLATIPEWTGTGNLIDIGTGAGFPGIPLKIAFPDLQMTLVESLNKKCLFLEAAINALGLNDVSIVVERAEIAAHNEKLRGSFSFVTARAVADLGVLCELLIPFAQIGAIIAPLKSQNIEDEIARAQAAAPQCGGELLRIEECQIPQSERRISIPVIKKVEKSEERFPRNYSAIQKKPLV
jgi:16S rRNA (guanine527-N7)-methyltransferase